MTLYLSSGADGMISGRLPLICILSAKFSSRASFMSAATWWTGSMSTLWMSGSSLLLLPVSLLLLHPLLYHSLQSNVVSVSNSSAAAHFLKRSFALTPESPLICWSSLTNDLICSVTNSCSASSLTFRRKSRRIVSTCFLSSSALKKVPQKLTQFALMMSHHCLFYKLIWLFYEMWFGVWFSWFGKNAKTYWDGPDKMSTKKLGRTKCQPQKKVRTKCQPLVGIMSGWHFVLPPFSQGSPFFLANNQVCWNWLAGM